MSAVPKPLATKSTSTLPTQKRVPSPRVDSGIGPRRLSDEKGGKKNVLDLEKVNEKLINVRESGGELKDWLALSKLLDEI
jgi:hypothetical protein